MTKPTTRRAPSVSSPAAAKARTGRPKIARRAKPAPAISDGWSAAIIGRVRTLIRQAVPDSTEEIKWRKPSNAMRGVPVWSHHGIICTGETYKDYVKLTFAKGATLNDPSRLFNASLNGGTRRAIDIRQGETINEKHFKALIREAASLNEGA